MIDTTNTEKANRSTAMERAGTNQIGKNTQIHGIVGAAKNLTISRTKVRTTAFENVYFIFF